MKRPSSLTDPRKSGKGCSDSSQNQRSEAQIFKYNNRCFKKFPQKDNWCNHGLFFELDESIMAITYRDTTKIVRFLFQSLELTFENPTKSSHMMSALLCLTCGTKNLGQCDPLSSIATGGSWRDVWKSLSWAGCWLDLRGWDRPTLRGAQCPGEGAGKKMELLEDVPVPLGDFLGSSR